MTRTSIVALLVAGLLAALGCPDPEEVGHAPKAQVDMAKERLDKATDKAAAGVQEAAKAAASE